MFPSLSMCVFCLLIYFVLTQCYPGRDWRLNGISLFQQFKDKGMIQYIQSLIPFYSFCCDMHTVCKIMLLTKKKKQAHLCVWSRAANWCLSWGKDSVSTAWHKKSLEIYELITRTGSLFFRLLWSALERLLETSLTRVPACASFCFFKEIHKRQRGAGDSAECSTLWGGYGGHFSLSF